MSGRPGPMQVDNGITPETINIVVWIFTALTIVAVFFRVYGRFVFTKVAGWDDVVIVLSLVINIVYSALISAAIHKGFGTHFQYVQPQNITDVILLIMACDTIGVLSFAVPKISVAILLVRIFTVKQWVSWLLPGLAISLTLLTMYEGIYLWFQCSPPSIVWHPELITPETKCLDPSIAVNGGYFIIAFSALLDFFYALFPVFFLYGLQMSSRRKWGIGCMMGFGTVAGIVTIYKATKLNELYDTRDATYTRVPLIFWSSVEASLVILAACVPTLGPFFIAIKPKIQSYRSSVTAKSTRKANGDYKVFKDDSTSNLREENPKGSKTRKSAFEVEDLELGTVGESRARIERIEDCSDGETWIDEHGIKRTVDVTVSYAPTRDTP